MSCDCHWVKVSIEGKQRTGEAYVCGARERDGTGAFVDPPTKFFEVEEFHEDDDPGTVLSPDPVIFRSTHDLPLVKTLNYPEEQIGTYACPAATQAEESGGNADDAWVQTGEEAVPADLTSAADAAVGDADEVTEEVVLTQNAEMVADPLDPGAVDWGQEVDWYKLRGGALQSAPWFAQRYIPNEMEFDKFGASITETEFRLRRTGSLVPVRMLYTVLLLDEFTSFVSETEEEVVVAAGEEFSAWVDLRAPDQHSKTVTNIRLEIPAVD